MLLQVKNGREQWITKGGVKCREPVHTGPLCSYCFAESMALAVL